MRKATLTSALLIALFCANAFAQDTDPAARQLTISLQTGTPMTAEKLGTENNRAEPVAEKARGNELVTAKVVAVEALASSPPRQRRIDYSPDQIAIVGFAADGTEVTRSVMIDPRLIRAEAILGENDLESTRLYRQSVDFSVALDNPDVVRIRILKPRWNGSTWQFDLLAETAVQ